MNISGRQVGTVEGRQPGMAGNAALQGLIRALNNQQNVFRLTGHMPNAQSYNNNLGYDMTGSGIVPRGQGAPFSPEPWMQPMKPWTR